MTTHPGRTPRRSRVRWYVAVLLATVAQLAFNLLPIADGWHGLGAGPHVEAVGATAHYAHAEETCAACHVHVVTARPAATVQLPVGYDERPIIRVPGGADAPAAAPTASHRSRAPPTSS